MDHPALARDITKAWIRLTDHGSGDQLITRGVCPFD
jgi:hypothetical protein